MEDEVELESPAAPRGAPIHQVPTQAARGLVDVLLAARADYCTERTWHKFLLDAYGGTGGFQGKVRQPFASYWGWAADVYRRDLPFVADSTAMDADIETYLDRFDREDTPKFQRRVNSSHYPNHVASFIDIPLSFMFRKQFAQKPDRKDAGSLGEWMDNADGAGNSWADIVRDTIAPRAAVLGWAPVLFDIPNNGTRMPTALDDERDARRPYAIPLFPSNVLDWNHDDQGTLRWAKIRNDYVRRDDPLEPGQDITRITIWFPDRWVWYELAKDRNTGQTLVVGTDEGTHPFKRVPLLVMRRKPVPDDAVRGVPMAGSASEEARRLFNYISELDEHLRSCAFAFLQVVTEDPKTVGAVIAGNGNALAVRPDWAREHKWVTPDPAVSEMYEKRISVTIEEMYRAQKMDFVRGVRGGQARSGISQSFEFESANRAIADFARQVARFDQEARRTVAAALTAAPARENITTTAPQRFDVEEMAKELDEALSAVTMKLGPTATAEIKKKVVRGVLSLVDPDVLTKIEQEIDQQAQLDASELGDLEAGDIRRAIQAARGNLDDPEDVLDEEGSDAEGAGGDRGGEAKGGAPPARRAPPQASKGHSRSGT